MRGQLDDQRRFTDANRGLVPAVRLLFDSLDSTLESAFRTGETVVDDGRASGDAARTMTQLHTLNDLLVAASTQSGAAIDLAVEPTPEHLAELEVAELTLRYANAAFLETLTDEQLLVMVPAGTGEHDVGRDGHARRGPGTADLTILTTSTPSVLAQVNYLDQLAVYAEGFHLRLRTDAMADSDAADLRVSIAVIALSVLGAALAIALALFVTRFLGPFLQLHRRAEVVAAGELPPVPRIVRGTRELKVVANSFDAMSGSLALIERQTAALATGSPRFGGPQDVDAERGRPVDRGGDRAPGDGDRSARGVGVEVVGDPRARRDRHLDDRDRRADPVGERGGGTTRRP